MPRLFDRSAMRASLRQSMSPAPVGAVPPTLHQQAEMKRKQTRIDRLRERERKEENLAHYKAEVAAEQAGVKLSEEQNSIVRMVEHGVAAQAENERKNHQATAMGGAQQSGLASTMGKDTKKNTASAPSPMLKDIMF